MSEQTSRKLFYNRSKEQIQAWRGVPVSDKLAQLQAQSEFFHKTMSERSRKISEKLKKPPSVVS